MKRVIFAALFLSLLWLLPGCQGNPTSPGSVIPKDAVKFIAISASSQSLPIGHSEVFKATATLFDGTTKTVTDGVWSSDLPSIATVEASTGRVTILGVGWVVISVRCQGGEADEFFEGVPQGL